MFSICLPCYFGRRPKFDAFSGVRPSLPPCPPLLYTLFAPSPRFSFKPARERTNERKTKTMKGKRRKRTRRNEHEYGESPSIRRANLRETVKRKGGRKKRNRETGVRPGPIKTFRVIVNSSTRQSSPPDRGTRE